MVQFNQIEYESNLVHTHFLLKSNNSNMRIIIKTKYHAKELLRNHYLIYFLRNDNIFIKANK